MSSPFPTGADRAQHRLSLCRAGTVAMTQRKAHDVPRCPRHQHQDLLFNCPAVGGRPLPSGPGSIPALLPERPGKASIHPIDLALVQEPSGRSTFTAFIWGVSASLPKGEMRNSGHATDSAAFSVPSSRSKKLQRCDRNLCDKSETDSGFQAWRRLWKTQSVLSQLQKFSVT